MFGYKSVKMILEVRVEEKGGIRNTRGWYKRIRITNVDKGIRPGEEHRKGMFDDKNNMIQ